MTWKTILILLSLLCFALVAFGVDWEVLNLMALGAFLFVATFIKISASAPKE